MSHDNVELLGLIGELLRAENEGTVDRARQILSESFIGITRSKGVERNRVELLEDMVRPPNPDMLRELEADSSWVTEMQDLAVTRTVVVTSSRRDAAAPRQRFRNTHVFEREAGAWRCVAWQVTELKTAV